MNNSFPKSARILKKSHFQHLMRASSKFKSPHLLIHYRLGFTKCSKLGLSVSKKYGKAHDRVFFKRLFREVFRLNRSRLPHNIELNVFPIKSTETVSYHDLQTDFLFFIDFLNRTHP
ncbi:MAG: ribonuclease P protein component [Rhabdochlamydiaceae bacterium]